MSTARPSAGIRGFSSEQLSTVSYDCVVIGGGLRIPPKSLLLFERLLNSVHKSELQASIAFNTSSPNTADAAARWLDIGCVDG